LLRLRVHLLELVLLLLLALAAVCLAGRHPVGGPSDIPYLSKTAQSRVR
jgi:hypothetical protein